jgi:hypothetical protein
MSRALCPEESSHMRHASLLVLVLVTGPTLAGDDKAPAWAAPMRKAHARFTGQKGTLALFGDSITVSRAFWAGLPGAHKNLSPEGKAAFDLVSGRIRKECWSDWRGPEFGNEGRMTVRWAHDNVAKWLKKLNPEVAVILFGTNDLGDVPLQEYEKKLREVVRTCLDNGTVVILTTPPPRAGQLERVKRYAGAVRRVAKELRVPLCDYLAECLKRRPDDWDGSQAKWKEYETYEVPTLISRDGVHPSYPKKYAGDYSDEALKSNGYLLRSYVTLLSYADVIRHVLNEKK